MHHVQVGIGQVVIVGSLLAAAAAAIAALDAGVLRLLAQLDDAADAFLLLFGEVQVGVGQVVGVRLLGETPKGFLLETAQ